MSISRRGFLQVAAAAQVPKNRPNVVVLFADDMSFRTIRSLNNPEIKTPNIDRLVARGTAFTHACIMGGLQGAVCVPSRAMLMSGQTVFHVTANVEQRKDWGEAKPFDMWPELLGRAGYQTIGIGKWHNGPALYHRAFQKGGPILFGGMADHYQTPLHDFNPEQKYPKDAVKPTNKHSSEIFADSAIRHIQTRDKSKPFALYCAFTAPHDPLHWPAGAEGSIAPDGLALPPNFRSAPEFDTGNVQGRDERIVPAPRTADEVRRERALYFSQVENVDRQVGRIVADVVAEWARRHRQPFALELLGPAGGRYAGGSAADREVLGPVDAVELCRTLAGRAPGDGLLTTIVPF